MLEGLTSRLSVSSCNELSDGELGRSVNAHKETELALSPLRLGDVDAQESGRVALALLVPGLIVCELWQVPYAVTLKAPVQR